MKDGYINQVRNEDCVTGINNLIEHGITVDLIVADPPYVISIPVDFNNLEEDYEYTEQQSLLFAV